MKIRIPSLHLELELIQSGCENLKQECRFILDGTYPQETSAAECAQDIATILYNISTFDKKLSDLSDWAEILLNNLQISAMKICYLFLKQVFVHL